jgi:hypothetical protein
MATNLIHINRLADVQSHTAANKGSYEMPTDSLLLSIAVCGVFVMFAAVLAWVDHSTTRWRLSQASQEPAAATTESPRKKAA